MRWVELCAGAAATTLRLLGGRDAVPLVSWMGGKRRHASAILRMLDVRRDDVEEVVLVDAGPWGRFWPMLIDQGEEVAAALDTWEGQNPRELWDWLREQDPAPGAGGVAQWLWLQARSASGVPVWHSSWRDDGEEGWRMGEEPSKSRRRTRGASQCSGGWLAAHDGRRPSDRGPDRRWAGGGIVHPSTIARRIRYLLPALRSVPLQVMHGDAFAFEPESDDAIYLDPPYVGCTGYGWDMGRARVLDVFARARSAGARIAVSAAVPLEVEGALAFCGGRRPEWLTLSHPAAWRPAEQLALVAP